MSVVFINSKANFELSNYKDGIIILFSSKVNSPFANTQLPILSEKKSEIESHGGQVFFITDAEETTDNEFFLVDTEREIINLSQRAKNQKNLGDNLIVYRKTGDKLEHLETKENPEKDSDWITAAVDFLKNYNDTELEDGYWKWGQVVPETGEYLCKDCGYIEEFAKGSIFPICEVCLAGEPSGPSTSAEGYWELV
jgi:hypothetical protein